MNIRDETIISYTLEDIMEPPSEKRQKKKDKERRNKELNGTFSAKHVRIQEALKEKKLLLSQPTLTTKK